MTTPGTPASPAPDASGHRTSGPRHRRLLVLGANGPTGRRLVHQALVRGHQVQALTRHPETFPLCDDRLQVIAGDATNPAVIDTAVAATDAVICTIGTAFTRHPVQVYSASARLLVQAMSGHGKRRLVVVTSGGVDTTHRPQGIAGRLSRSVLRNRIGKTVYDDMEAMEAVVWASDLDWTVVRPPGLTEEPGTDYAIAPERIQDPFMSRDDLAAALLDQLQDHRYVRKVAAVATPGLRVSGWYMFHREVLKR
ncbi:NAD(P)-dependent oxidoreductase [Quadrisphaera sp. INWT6]|uniref:NAD(P)-dependent oxidoreductase n=1 Tax=Quadrisphaera sp. INWT6 TaxID=2596917 RepID=UPI001892043C|nr:NAD(P)H-binding protein [Quadrisphaera sp. INWT6]